MIPCVGKKAIIGWKDLTADIMDDERHLASLRNRNVAIVNGEKSGGLCCIDVDDEEFGKVLLEKNPLLRDTTQTKGRRNCNYWVRFIGNYPRLYHLKFGGKEVGEFRSTGGYSVIAGKHPEEGSYTIPNKVFPIELGFKQLWLPNQPNNLNQADYTERTDEDRENGRGLVSGESKKGDLSEEFVVNRSLPTSPRQNHSCLFKLARGMKDDIGLIVAHWGLADAAHLEKDEDEEVIHLSQVVAMHLMMGEQMPKDIKERLEEITG